jgi:hypothetical protein
MKKTIIALAAALLVAGIASAQTVAPAPAAAQAQVTKISGKLELVQGVIGLKSGGKTYLVPKLQRLAGFVKGVEEGSTVSLEGYEAALPYTSDVVFFQATKLTVAGKDYDLGQVGAPRGGMGMGKMGGGMGMGKRGGRW